MAHPRTLIRDAAYELLLAGNTLAGSSVYKSRFRRLSPSDLPALLVYARRDNAGRNIADAPRIYRRELALVVEAIVSATAADVDDQIDLLARDVESLFENNETLGGLVHDVAYQSTEIDLDGSTDPPVGVATLTFAVIYEDDIKQPVSDDFTGADVVWNIPGDPDTEEAQDTINVTP